MSKNTFTIARFFKAYPNDDACLDAIFKKRFGTEITCIGCGDMHAKFYKVRKRKCYACSSCGHQIHPLAGTIFHKSSTSLQSWFFAMYLFSTSKNGVAAKELERQLGVTYKMAWRMAHQIRLLFKQDGKLGGADKVVETDETYYGGKHRRWQRYDDKTPIIGSIERGVSARMKVIDTASRTRAEQYVKDTIELDSVFYTDESRLYLWMKKQGIVHDSVNHSMRQYANGSVHTNTIESFWGRLKRSLSGTHHSVSRKHLQHYVDEFVFRYNLRGTAVWPGLFALAARPLAPG